MCLGKQRALSLDIWISPNLCVILRERQFISSLIYIFLNVQVACECPCEMVRYTEPETRRYRFELDLETF